MLLFLDSIGGSEIVMILLFVLIFFGADSIPGLASGLGRTIRQVKDAGQNIQDEIMKTTVEMKREMNINKALNEAKNTMEKTSKEITQNLTKTGEQIEKNLDKTFKEVEENLENTPKDQLPL